VFAAIRPLPDDEEEAARALATAAFRRFPLAPGRLFEGGTAEFQYLFAMSVDGVQGVPDPRVARLSDEARVELEIRWVSLQRRCHSLGKSKVNA
jgi:hypothetical protein